MKDGVRNEVASHMTFWLAHCPNLLFLLVLLGLTALDKAAKEGNKKCARLLIDKMEEKYEALEKTWDMAKFECERLNASGDDRCNKD